VSCRNCGSDWTTPKGKDCNRCPHCDKLQRCLARKQGRLPAVIKKTCRICGNTFAVTPNSQHAKTCRSEDCQAVMAKEKALRHKERKASGSAATQAQRQERKQCKRHGCDAAVKDNRHDYCSPICAGADVRDYKRDFMGVPAAMRLTNALADWMHDWERDRPTLVSCLACKAQIEQRRGTTRRFCNNRCRSKIEGFSHRKRCKRFGVPFDCSVKKVLVFRRDRYVCQLCKRRCLKKFKVDAATGTPHQRSPTVDHIIAISLGIKGHTWDNVQCCCWECNVAKGAQAKGQLRFAEC